VTEINAAEALGEKVRREKARRHLIPYSTYIAPWYMPGRHHKFVASKLEAVERYIETQGREGIGRLILEEAPRHGKTEQVSRLFPSWLLGKLPDSQVIITAYGADLAQGDSRAVRDYVMLEKYRAVFGDLSTIDEPVTISEDSRSVAGWSLAAPHRGGVVAAGVGGAITGKGAHLLIVDDPFKNRDEADSEAYRKRVMSWWKSSAYTRLEKGAAVIITHTRWHPNDLAGELLMAMASDMFLADQWEVIYLPAIALKEEEYLRDEGKFQENLLRGVYIPERDPLGRKGGEALWPEKYDEGALAKIRANIGEDEFGSLYQQQPRPPSSGFFQETDFGIVDLTPSPFPEGKGSSIRWFVYVDLALGEKEKSDWNAALATALDETTGIVYYRNLLRVHDLTEFLRQLESWMVLPSEIGTTWGFEDVAFQKLVLKDLLKKPRLAALAMKPVKPNGDKVERARAIQTRGRLGQVKLVRGAWNLGFVREALAFPTGDHDDQVDTASGGLQMVAEPRRVMRKARSYQG
jgi:phage terminase large subunit-like protein